MQPFVSTVVNKLDAKRRVSVPAAFRQVLAEDKLKGFYCFPSFAGQALEAYGVELLKDFQGRLASVNPLFSEDYDAQAQAVLGESEFLNFDDEGRVRLPDAFINHAVIQDRVLFVGMDKKFQIWNPDVFEPIRKARIELARAAYRPAGAPR